MIIGNMTGDFGVSDYSNALKTGYDLVDECWPSWIADGLGLGVGAWLSDEDDDVPEEEEILQDSCPVEWIGSRIVTPLPDTRFKIVPNRLTYLSAPRTLPSRLITQNWSSGAEWRDWFVTGIGVETLPVPEAADIRPRLDQHLQAMYRLEQEAIAGGHLELQDPVAIPLGLNIGQGRQTEHLDWRRALRPPVHILVCRGSAEGFRGDHELVVAEHDQEATAKGELVADE